MRARAFGVSVDTVEKHKKFVEKHKLNITLLADPEKVVVRKFSGTNLLGWANRKSFLIDPFGKLRKIYDDVNTKTHASEVLRDLEGLTEIVESLGKLESSNRQILESITAASRIQKALLPELDTVKSQFKDFSLLWEPRDIVGGDCYWTVKNNNHIWFGLFDCTGHGIPGAFVTLILLSKLSRIFHNARGFSDFRPSTLLEEVDTSLKDSFNQERSNFTREGADGCVLLWEIGSNEVIISGANMSLITQINDKICVHTGVRRSLGYGRKNVKKFEDKILSIEKSSRIFLFSDGVIDEGNEVSGISYGRKNLQNLLVDHKSSTLDELTLGLKESLSKWRNSRPRRDDVSFVAIEPL